MTEAMFKPLRHDPKRLAREFLRLRGVSYKDLITGDHAADLFVEFNKHITDWNIQVEKLLEEQHMWKVMTEPTTMCLPKDSIPGSK